MASCVRTHGTLVYGVRMHGAIACGVQIHIACVTPEGNKGKRYKEKGSRTVSHVTRIPDERLGASESSSARTGRMEGNLDG